MLALVSIQSLFCWFSLEKLTLAKFFNNKICFYLLYTRRNCWLAAFSSVCLKYVAIKALWTMSGRVRLHLLFGAHVLWRPGYTLTLCSVVTFINILVCSLSNAIKCHIIFLYIFSVNPTSFNTVE